MKGIKKYIFVAILSFFVLSWLGVIFGNSAQTGEVSGGLSAKVCDMINSVIDPVFGFTVSHKFVRKFAHFAEYAILAALVAADVIACVRAFTQKSRKSAAIFSALAIPLSVVVAAIDEFGVQASTLGRGPSIIDVLIDSSGAIIGTAFIAAVYMLIYRKKHERSAELTDEKEILNTQE
ncbi:MAG: VanZ family protein [Clostridia bacterium]|nr:VanZ family protein [Clostridia bacterium]